MNFKVGNFYELNNGCIVKCVDIQNAITSMRSYKKYPIRCRIVHIPKSYNQSKPSHLHINKLISFTATGHWHCYKVGSQIKYSKCEENVREECSPQHLKELCKLENLERNFNTYCNQQNQLQEKEVEPKNELEQEIECHLDFNNNIDVLDNIDIDVDFNESGNEIDRDIDSDLNVDDVDDDKIHVKDFMDQNVYIGDTITYPTRQGSSLYMNAGTVVDIVKTMDTEYDGFHNCDGNTKVCLKVKKTKSSGYWNKNEKQRISTISVLDRIVKFS